MIVFMLMFVLERPCLYLMSAASTFMFSLLQRSNLALSEDLYRDGYENIVNVDFSESVIRMMRERCREMAHMECRSAVVSRLRLLY